MSSRLTRTPLRTRFLVQFSISPSGCWMWTGTKNSAGYGQIKDHYRTKSAHRVSWELFFGEIPEGKLVCHKCDEPSCVNPDHLFCGSASDNMRDMQNKGRQRYLRGEENPNSRLTEKEVSEIRVSKEKGVVLAKQYEVSPTTICEIRTGRKHKQANERQKP